MEVMTRGVDGDVERWTARTVAVAVGLGARRGWKELVSGHGETGVDYLRLRIGLRRRIV